jgi:hypothetical protein
MPGLLFVKNEEFGGDWGSPIMGSDTAHKGVVFGQSKFADFVGIMERGMAVAWRGAAMFFKGTSVTTGKQRTKGGDTTDNQAYTAMPLRIAGLGHRSSKYRTILTTIWKNEIPCRLSSTSVCRSKWRCFNPLEP